MIHHQSPRAPRPAAGARLEPFSQAGRHTLIGLDAAATVEDLWGSHVAVAQTLRCDDDLGRERLDARSIEASIGE